jgi:hypothetical protein
MAPYSNLHETKKKMLFRNKRKSDSEEGIWNSEWFAIVSLELVYLEK